MHSDPPQRRPHSPSNLVVELEAQAVRPWSSLRFGAFRLLWTSGMMSSVGEQGRRAVDLWLVYQLSGGSPLQLGLIGLFQAAPVFLMGLLGGTIVDLVDRKKLLVYGHSIRVALLILMTALVVTGAVQVWHIYVMTLLTGTVQVVEGPARTSLIPAIVPRSLLLNALALNTSMRQIGLLTGPVIAGFLIAAAGSGLAYVFHAMLYAFGVAFLVFIKVHGTFEMKGLKTFRLRQVVEGIRFVWRDRFLTSVICLDIIAVMFTSWRVLIPIFAVDILGGDERTLGMLLAAPSFGQLVGTGVVLLLSNVRRQGVFVLAVTMGYAASIALFALSQNLWLSLFLLVLVGATDGIGMIVRQTVVQVVVHDEVRGRVTSVSQVFGHGSSALSQMSTGAVASALGAAGALLLGATVTAAAVLYAGSWVREMRTFRLEART